MQFQSDIIDRRVYRPVIRETTALGAAYLAGLAVGVWNNTEEIKNLWKCDIVFEPSMDEALRQTLLKDWNRAVSRSYKWIPDERI